MIDLALQSAFILRVTPHREAHLWLDCLTEHSGRVSCTARSGKSSPSSRGVLQLFTPLLISGKGRGEYPFLSRIEAEGVVLSLPYPAFLSGCYLNELLLRVLPVHAPCSALFEYYRIALQALAAESLLDPILRNFEWMFLHEIGHGFSFEVEAHSDRAIAPGGLYRWSEGGFVSTPYPNKAFSGGVLLAIAEGNYGEKEVRREAKRLSRLAFEPLLRGIPLAVRRYV